MEECWKELPRDLLGCVFKYLGYKYLITEITRWMLSKDIVYMIGTTPFEHFVRQRNITGCILFRKIYPRRKINWSEISKCYLLSEEFIQIYHNHLDWYWLTSKQTLSERTMDSFPDKLDWWNVSLKQKMSDEFKEKYKDKIIRRLIRE